MVCCCAFAHAYFCEVAAQLRQLQHWDLQQVTAETCKILCCDLPKDLQPSDLHNPQVSEIYGAQLAVNLQDRRVSAVIQSTCVLNLILPSRAWRLL